MISRALILSNQRPYANSLKSLLEEQVAPGCRVDVETDALRAMQISPRAYQLIVLDAELSGTDGLQLLLMKKRQSAATKFIMVSDFPNELTRFQAFQNGASVFLVRPAGDAAWPGFMKEISDVINPAGATRAAVDAAPATVPVADIIQTECLSGHSTGIQVYRGEEIGDIFIYQGELYHAQCAGMSGPRAFFHIVAWPMEEVSIKTLKLAHIPPQTIEPNWQQMLEESRRGPEPYVDEESAISITPVYDEDVPEQALEMAHHEAPPLDLADPATGYTDEGAENTDETGPNRQFGEVQNELQLPSLISHWKINLMGELMEGFKVDDPDQAGIVSFFLYRKLADVAVALESDYFTRLSLQGTSVTHELVADNFGVRHGTFRTDDPNCAQDREAFIAWCYGNSL
ncbi:hypothetical protein DB346_19290 [Verrucomicrobia bacterium LW23]|nr:hypothetical protein DB346_19290 [Verrucomicrobia bacterium LW23]